MPQKQQQQNLRRMQQNQVIHDSFTPEKIGVSQTEFVEKKIPEKPSYVKYTFFNPYNLTLFGGALVAALLTFSPLIAIAAFLLEGLWMLHGSQSRFMQRVLWDPIFEKEKAELEQEERMRVIGTLSQHGQKRINELINKENEIKKLAEQNPSFTGDLLRGELAKTSHLVNAFIDLGVTCARYEKYLRSVNTKELTQEKQRWENYVESNKENSTDVEIQIAQKNVEVINKRIERVGEIQRYLNVAFGQLNLIENSFKLIADQIVTMQSPSELSGQLDELVDGVESIKETAKETEQILRTL